MNYQEINDLQYSSSYNNDLSTDSELYIFVDFGYLVEIDGREEVVLELKDEKLLDSGLVTGFKQNDDIVDLYFVSNNISKDVSFKKDAIYANKKNYKYDKVKIRLHNGEAFLVSNDDHEFILQFNEEVYDMFSSVINNEEEDSCVISVLDSKICACGISNGTVIWMESINLGDNKFDAENSMIITKKNQKFNVSDCYLRVCVKKIYLHVDESSGTLILGKINNPKNNN